MLEVSQKIYLKLQNPMDIILIEDPFERIRKWIFKPISLECATGVQKC